MKTATPTPTDTSDRAIDLLEAIARMNYDGEDLADGEWYCMENDDAVKTVSDLVISAREILKGGAQ